MRAASLLARRSFLQPVDKVAPSSYLDVMRAVGLKVLKNKLAEYVRLAVQGETVLITDRGQVVTTKPSAVPLGRTASMTPNSQSWFARAWWWSRRCRAAFHPVCPSLRPSRFCASFKTIATRGDLPRYFGRTRPPAR